MRRTFGSQGGNASLQFASRERPDKSGGRPLVQGLAEAHVPKRYARAPPAGTRVPRKGAAVGIRLNRKTWLSLIMIANDKIN